MAKCDINKEDNVGLTPLHRAAYRGHEDVVKLLLLHGADKTKVRKRGKTPLDLADKEEIKKLLDSH